MLCKIVAPQIPLVEAPPIPGVEEDGEVADEPEDEVLVAIADPVIPLAEAPVLEPVAAAGGVPWLPVILGCIVAAAGAFYVLYAKGMIFAGAGAAGTAAGKAGGKSGAAAAKDKKERTQRLTKESVFRHKRHPHRSPIRGPGGGVLFCYYNIKVRNDLQGRGEARLSPHSTITNSRSRQALPLQKMFQFTSITKHYSLSQELHLSSALT